MKNILFTIFSLFACFTILTAQESPVLFTVNDKPVYVNEFERVYKKNLDLVQDDTQKDIGSYLDLFVNYKLKLEEAYNLKLDKDPTYLRELKGYERQLKQKYVNDNAVTDALVLEAYERLGKEVNANHVLVKLDANASEAEEAKALEQIKALRVRVLNEGFDVVKKDVHNGKTIFAEELGYFTAFKMVYNFEAAAYTTKVGDVSQPFKTQFGYHVVLVSDVRINRGEVTVAHIMVNESDKELINKIHQRLEQGEDFKSLAKQYSIDKSSANKGGMLAPFTGGQLSSTSFEESAFKLEKRGDFTAPFKTKFGYHIIKLYAKTGLDTFDAEKAGLSNKVKRDSRSQILNDQRIAKLLKTYNVSYTNANLKDFETGLNDRFFNGLWNAPGNLTTDKVLVNIQDKTISYNDFTDYLKRVQRKPQSKRALNKVVKTYYKSFLDEQIAQYQEDNLVNDNQEFANILTEYKEGLLLFELMGKKIWNSSDNDSIALQDYYTNNKVNYKFKKRIEATLASSAKKSIAKKVLKALKKGDSISAIEKIFNSKNVAVTFNSDEFNVSDPAIPSKLSLKEGFSKVYNHNGSYVVVQITKILQESTKSFEEAKGAVMSDFQDQKEKNWLIELKKKFPLKINTVPLNALKAKYN